MDLISTKLCRLCLESSEVMLNIFENYQNSTISAILTKHFWFWVDRNDGMPEWLCQICWIQIKTFHHFYKRIEARHANYSSTNDLVNAVKQERCVTPNEEAVETDLDLVKQEETEQSTEMVDVSVTKKENCDYNSYLEGHDDDNSCDESENSLTSDEDDQPRNEKSNGHDDQDATATEKPSINISRKDTKSRSQPKKALQDAQIREFFTMKCELCTEDDIRFETFTNARKHYRSVHRKSGYLMCCGNKFHRRYRILDHIRFHINPVAYRCDQCERSFKDREALKIHTDNHVPLSLRAHKCSLCSSSFTKAASLKIHVQNIHSSVTGEMFPCEKCNKNFRSPTLLASHIRSVHEFSLEHVCEICARRFKTKTMLRNHTASEHPATPQLKAQCNICGIWLKHEVGLRKHLKRHQDAKCETIECPVCKKEVKSSESLKRHIRFVHGERHFQCQLCDKAFKTAIILKEHVAWHTGQDLYNCRYCEKKFKSSANMYAHGKKAHLAEWSRDFSQRSSLGNKPME